MKLYGLINFFTFIPVYKLNHMLHFIIVFKESLTLMKHQISRSEVVHNPGRQMKSSKTQHINNGKVNPVGCKKGRYNEKLRSHKKAEDANELLMHKVILQNTWTRPVAALVGGH